MKELNFKKREVFPDAGGAFFFKLKPIDEIKNSCLVVVDTNALIVPFTSGNKSIEAIRELYRKLSDEDRLFVPVHVVREFLDNRASRLSSLHNALSDKSSQSFKELDDHPLLKELSEFEDVKKAEKEIVESFKKYRKAINETKKVIKGWGWNDPVSKMYHEVLDGRILDDVEIDADDILKDAKRREDLNIPPGYKDASKEENKVGDLLIWGEIISLAKKEKNDLIFVTHEEKADWWHKSSGGPLYTRMELVDEYRRASEGKSFHIKSLSEVLSIFGANRAAVEEVEKSEVNTARGNVTKKGDAERELDRNITSLYKELNKELVRSSEIIDSYKDEYFKLIESSDELRRKLLAKSEKLHEDFNSGKLPNPPKKSDIDKVLVDEIREVDRDVARLKQRLDNEYVHRKEIMEKLKTVGDRMGLGGIGW